MDGSSSRLNPYTPPNDSQVLYAPYTPSRETIPLLEVIFWSTTFLRILASSVFLS
jgi:hypothetical protein